MSAISLKSITGITSITTPAGVDNQLTLHTNNTTERFKIDEAGNVRVANTFDCVGVSTFRNNLFAQADLRIAGEIVHLSDDDTRMQFPSNDTIAFKTAGSERLRINSSGNVTINRDLDVDGHTNLDNVSVAGVTTMTGALKISSTTDQMLELNSSDNNGTSLAFQRNGSRQGYIGYGGASNGLIIANEMSNGAIAIQGNDGGSIINMLSFDSANKGLATLHGGATIPLDLDVDGHTNLDNVSVGGATTCNGGAVFLNSISLNASSNNYLYFDDILHFSRNGHGTEMMIDGSGRMILGATSTIGNTYSDNFTVSEASGNVGMQFAGNNSTSNYASIYFGDAGHRQKHFIETQLGTNGQFTIGTIGTGAIRFTNSNGQQARITTNLVEANSTFGIANVGGSIGGSGGTENWIGIKDSGGNFKFVVKTHSASSGNFGKVGINNTNPTHPFHIVNTSSTFNSASLIKGDNSTSGQGAYATFTNTADSKSAYFGLDGSGLFNLDAGTALVGTSGDESIIFATNGNDMKVRIFGGTDNVIQLKGGGNLSISDYAPNQTFSGTYGGFHHDNHGNTLIGLNAHLNYSSNSGTHQWKQTNAHPTIGSAGMFIGGNGSSNNTNITFFRNSQGSSAGTTFAQDSWKFQIGSDLRQNYNERYLQRGFFKTDTSNQTASNFPLAAGSGVGGYAFGYQEAFSTSGGTWVNPYPDLVLGYHTGMRFGAWRSYGGCRFYQDHPYNNTNIVLSIGNGSTGVHVTNSFTAGSNKGFRIAHPHPSKKYTHDLVHNAIEAPQMDLIYRGKVDLVGGSATVNIDTKAGITDGTFVLLNRDVQCFTSNETGWTAVKGSVSGNILTITAQDNSCTDTISWMVVGERQDDKIKESELTTADGDLITEPLTIEETHM